MTNMDDLEKLADLKKKGVITAPEFEQQKETLLSKTTSACTEQKSEAAYLLLAFFLGCFGIHNFYAGYVGRGIAQLLISLLLSWLILPILAVEIWVFVEICTVRQDAAGKDFIPTSGLRTVLIVIEVVLFFAMLAMCGLGVLASFSAAIGA